MRKNHYKYPYSWSQSSPEAMTFEKALAYCDNLEESGFDDWRLPEMQEIKSIDELCVEEENSDFCAVTDSCEWDGCETELCGKCVKYANWSGSGLFWTKTETHGGKVSVFKVTAETSGENQSLKDRLHLVKCVRDR